MDTIPVSCPYGCRSRPAQSGLKKLPGYGWAASTGQRPFPKRNLDTATLGFCNCVHLRHSMSWPLRQRTALGIYHLLEQEWPLHVWESKRSHVSLSTRLCLVYLSLEPIEQFSLVLMFKHYTEIWEKQVVLHPVSNMIIKIIFQDTLEVSSSNNVPKKIRKSKA